MILYIFWSLLPLALFGFGTWSFLRPHLKVKGRENTKNYFSQAIFCSLGLVISIAIDSTKAFEELIDLVSFSMLDFSIARFLLYPAVLLLMALAQDYLLKTGSKRTLPKRENV